MSRLIHVILAAALAVFAAGATLASAAGPSAQLDSADLYIFVSPCDFSHRAKDDLIVFPGKPGAAHSHDFFGNRSTNARSTRSNMLGRSSSCSRVGDTAAYWVPTLSQAGRALTPVKSEIYYRADGGGAASVKPHPAGLRMISGNSKATTPQGAHIATWHCGVESNGGFDRRSEVPLCASGRQLHLQVRFQDCWDGRRLDSTDHQSHLAYSAYNRCPSSHKVRLPRIAFNVRYPTRGGPGVTFSSGSRHSAHADFLNSWNQDGLNRLVRDCINNGPVPQHRPPCAAPR